jgi:hypothetical protein
MNLDSLTFGDARRIAAMFSNVSMSNRLAEDGKIRIAVLQRGNVVIGKYSQNGEIGQLDNAYVIRKWGTTEGLGELATKGPLPDSAPKGPTRLDKCPPVKFHIREVIFLMEVNADAWGKLFYS